MKNQLKKLALRLRGDERGLTTVEYMILLCLISAFAVGTWKVFGSEVQGDLQKASDGIHTATAEGAQGAPPPH